MVEDFVEFNNVYQKYNVIDVVNSQLPHIDWQELETMMTHTLDHFVANDWQQLSPDLTYELIKSDLCRTSLASLDLVGTMDADLNLDTTQKADLQEALVEEFYQDDDVEMAVLGHINQAIARSQSQFESLMKARYPNLREISFSSRLQSEITNKHQQVNKLFFDTLKKVVGEKVVNQALDERLLQSQTDELHLTDKEPSLDETKEEEQHQGLSRSSGLGLHR